VKEYRDLIDQLLCKTATEMVNQWNIVNAAFSDRIREYIKARTDLETHLAKVRTSIQPHSAFRDYLMIMLMTTSTTTIMMKHVHTAKLPRLAESFKIWKK